MNKLFLTLCAVGLAAATFAQEPDRSIRPEPGPAPEINLGDVQTFTLKNGLKVFVVENHKLPTISVSVQLDIKPALEGDKAGVSDMIGSLITAGTKSRSKAEFDEEVDRIGATISASSRSIYGFALKKHQSQLLELLSDALLNADFKQDELDKLKKQAESALATAKNEPDAMLDNVSNVLNFGKGHPYGEVPREETVREITLQDCQNYYSRYFRPNVAYLAFVGDINVEEAKQLTARYFEPWEKAEVPVAEYPVAAAPDATVVEFVPREGAVQSVIGITYPIQLKPGHEDVIKARLMNEILGGSSQGRLFLNLRESKAWTYGSYSSLSQDELVGSVQLYAKARNEVTDSSVAEMLKEMHRIREEKVSPAVLENMKNYMGGVFAIGLESPQTIAQYAINIDRYGMSKDYYENYLKNLEAVTVDDVEAAAKKYIRPEHSHIIVVGSKDEAGKLERFSEQAIRYYDAYGNPIEVKAATALGADVTADRIVEKYIDAIGGRKAVEAVKTIKLSGAAEVQNMLIKFDQAMQSPDKYKMTVQMNGMVLQKIVLDGDSGYTEAQGQKTDMDEKSLAMFRRQADIQGDLHPEKHGVTLKVLGQEEVEGVAAYAVEETDKEGNKVVKYYAVESGLLIRTVARLEVQGQEMVQITNYKNYQEVKNGAGYKMPFTIEQVSMGLVMEVQSVEANVTFKDGTFK